MTWNAIATIQVTQEWRFTPVIASHLGYFRLSFETAGVPLFIATVNPTTGDYFDQRRIVATPYAQIFEFECPSVFVNRAIALRLPASLTPFEVQVEVSDTPVASSSGSNGGTVDFTPVLNNQAQILQALESLEVDLDPQIVAQIAAIVNRQLNHTSQLNQILEQLDQPAIADPAIVNALTTLLNGQTAQSSQFGQFQFRQTEHSALLQQVLSGQTQILQSISSPAAPPQYELITTPYVASQSSVYMGLAATYANLNDNNGATGAGTNSSPNEWIKAAFESPVTVRAVRVGGGNLPNWGTVAGYLNGRVLQYSTDDVNWLTIQTISNVQDSGPGQFALFPLAQPITARFWRIRSSDWFALTELRFFS
ncbi:hypothetical protein LEP3755_01750 [Leptolyngbya sp. NIES-3755]|nr:hypothetical protein LEP3755_01750 [Leptolyngbya sp. NIES-3755]